MPMFLRVLPTECLKLKRTLALWMVLVSPLVIILLQFAVTFKRAPGFIHDGKDAWAPMVRQTIEIWTLLMMPLFVTLETALLAGLENAGRNWKSLLALPAPRWTIYGSKLLVSIALLWIAHLILIAGTVGSAELLRLFFPKLDFGRMPMSPFLMPMLRVSLAGLFGLAIQHWVSLRWPSYPAAMGFGMSVMILGVFIAQSPAFGPWFPWSLPIHAVLNGAKGGELTTFLGMGGALVATAAGCWEFVRREIG